MQRRIFWASAAVPWNWKQCKRAARQALERLICHGEFGVSIPLEQVGRFQPVMEEPILKRRDRDLTFEVRADILKGTQPPDVGKAVYADLQPLIAQLPAGYRVTIGGPVEESAKANKALAVLFPVMIMLTLVVIMFQVRSFALMFMVFATAPLGLIGAVPVLLLFDQPFGFNAILALIGIGGILMRNTLIFTDQIEQEQAHGRPCTRRSSKPRCAAPGRCCSLHWPPRWPSSH